MKSWKWMPGYTIASPWMSGCDGWHRHIDIVTMPIIYYSIWSRCYNWFPFIYTSVCSELAFCLVRYAHNIKDVLNMPIDVYEESKLLKYSHGCNIPCFDADQALCSEKTTLFRELIFEMPGKNTIEVIWKFVGV